MFQGKISAGSHLLLNFDDVNGLYKGVQRTALNLRMNLGHQLKVGFLLGFLSHRSSLYKYIYLLHREINL